jgi:PIN domain nuclease of toxin-antitoxin system
MSVVLDTDALIWYLLDSDKLPQKIYSLVDRALADGEPAYISSISLVEIIYLTERSRIAPEAFEKIVGELQQDTPAFRIASVDLGIAKALKGISSSAVPDMPDRIIAATAVYFNLPLVTRDRRLTSLGIKTVW